MPKYVAVALPLCIAHRSREGRMHGHTYRVVATFPAGDMLERREQLRTKLAEIDHDIVPDELAWSEDLAEHIGRALPDCARVELRRDEEGFIGGWVAE